GLGDADHTSTVNTLTAQGYRPVNLALAVVGGVRRYYGFWEQSAAGSWAVQWGLTEAQYTTAFSQQAAAGRHVSYLSAFTESGIPKINAVFDQSDVGATAAGHALTAAQAQTSFDNEISRGKLTRSIAGYENGGALRFAYLWSTK